MQTRRRAPKAPHRRGPRTERGSLHIDALLAVLVLGMAVQVFSQITTMSHRQEAIDHSRNVATEQLRATLEAARAVKFNALGFAHTDRTAPATNSLGETTVTHITADTDEHSQLLKPATTMTRSGIRLTQRIDIAWSGTAGNSAHIATGPRTKRVTVKLTWTPRGTTDPRTLTYELQRTPNPSEERTIATLSMPEHSS